MRSVSTFALLSSLAISSAQAGSNSPSPHQRQAIARRADAVGASSVTATSAVVKHVRSSTSSASASAATVTAKPQKVNAAADTAGGSALPLTEYTYSALSAVPYQVNPYKSARGPQTGYNICNSTTQGDTSECQTLIINSISDLCLWGLPGGPKDLSTIGDSEAATVAYCVQDTHGARSIPAGAITGLQYMKTKAYIQISGYIDQTVLGMTKDDSGGELDPHGADLLGNPLGGLVFSSGLPSGDNSTEQQVVEWNNFVGGGYFCFKLCDPTYNDGHNYCQNRYDLMGCSYNMPAAVKDGEFTECDGDLQDEVGIYTTNGQVMTYSQPPEGSPVNPPYTPRVPASSNCKTYQSTEILGVATTSATSSASSASDSASASGSTSASAGKTTASPSSANSKSDSSSTKDSSAFGLFLPSTVFALVIAGGAAVLF